MEIKTSRMDLSSHLMLARTSLEELREGVMVVTKGEGVWIFDQDGKRYLDLVAGMTRAVHVGYGRKEMAQAVYDQICQLHYFSPVQFANLPAITLAEVLSGISPGKINRFFFVCDGSEAVESAIKLARQYHLVKGDKRRYKVISRRGAYHGATSGALNVLGTALSMRQMMEPLAPGTIFVESPYCYRCPVHLSYPECDIACARDIARIIEFEDPAQVSAFIAEPIQQGFGAYAPPKEYWKIIQEICEKYGILLILDEVVCGFGRTGKWFGTNHLDIQPDVITIAKGLSSGYVPLGGVGCTDEIWESIGAFQHIHTYANHPVACAAALRNIELIKDEKLVENAHAMGIYFLEKLKTLESHPTVGEVRGTGLWTAIDFTSDKKRRTLLPSSHVNSLIARARAKGLIIRTMGITLEFAPPLIIKREEIDQAVKILEQCITEEEKEIGLMK